MIDEKIKDIIEVIKSGGEYISNVTTKTLLPFVNIGDTIHITKNRGIYKNDIIIYKYNNGNYQLTRVVKINKYSYSVCPDNVIKMPDKIYFDQIVGRVIQVTHDGKDCINDSLSYRLYLRLINIRSLKRIFLRFKFRKNIIKKETA